MTTGRALIGPVLGVLATALAACSDVEPPPITSVVPDSVDMVIYGFTSTMTTDGVISAQLEADSAYHFVAQRRAELFGVRVEFHSPQGELRSTLTSREGTYFSRSGDMEARGDVVADTPDGRRLTTCELRYDALRDEITGPCAFVFDAPNRHLEGASFTADPDFRNVVAQQARQGRAGAVEIER